MEVKQSVDLSVKNLEVMSLSQLAQAELDARGTALHAVVINLINGYPIVKNLGNGNPKKKIKHFRNVWRDRRKW